MSPGFIVPFTCFHSSTVDWSSISRGKMAPANPVWLSSAALLWQFFTSQWRMTVSLHHGIPLAGKPLYTLFPEKHPSKNAFQTFRNLRQNIVSWKACSSALPVLEPNPGTVALLSHYFCCPFLAQIVFSRMGKSHREWCKEPLRVKNRHHERKHCSLYDLMGYFNVSITTNSQIVIAQIPSHARSEELWVSDGTATFLYSEYALVTTSKPDLSIPFQHRKFLYFFNETFG